MTHEDKWQARWQKALTFIEASRRNPSKFDGAEREIRNWIKQQRKLRNAGALNPARVERFEHLQRLMEFYKRKNQYE